MRRHLASGALAGAICAATLLGSTAPAGATAAPAASTASCMGSGASFYGTFAPQQMAFVVEYVSGLDGPAGATFSTFAEEKEGGSIPAPCGTRLE